MNERSDADRIFQIEASFTQLIADLLEREGHQIRRAEEPLEPDLVVKLDGRPTVVEVKVHRAPGIVRHNIADAYYQIGRMMKRVGAQDAVLVITLSAEILTRVPAWLQVWGVKEIASRLAPHLDLTTRFFDLMQALLT